MFANFPGANGEAQGSICPDRVADPNHSHFAALQPNGLLDAAGDCHYVEEQIPNYWKVARAFTLCDDFYTGVRGPSAPNYFMLTSAQSPIIDSPASEDCPPTCSDAIAMPDRLIEKGVTWADYGGIFKSYPHLADRPEIITPITQQSRIIDDALAGALPNVSWLISYFDYSGHPPASLCVAENWMVRVLNAIMHGPQWESTAVFLTWDDWGGFYDHVEPPVLETWSDGTPFRLGHRVPCTVVSPYAKAGYVSHQQNSFLSLLKFIETIFDLEPLNERDAQAGDMLDCFDFNQSPQPPIDLVERNCA
jgi:phospholipase C